MRRLVVLAPLALAAFVALGAAPARAGGSWFQPDKGRYEPGDTVTLVGHTGGGQLGWIDDGPFFGYLNSAPDGWSWGGANDPGNAPVGEILVEETGLGGGLQVRASITFALAEGIEPGVYHFVYCNAPCETGLGDLVGAALYVGVDPPVVDEQVIDEPITTTSTTSTTSTTVVPEPTVTVAPDDGGGFPVQTAAITGGALVGVAGAGFVATRRYKNGGPARSDDVAPPAH